MDLGLGAYYPPGAFRFGVMIDDPDAGMDLAGIDASFQEVSGIKVEFGSEEVAEGGENRFAHRLPTAARYSNLTLKRGVVTLYSPFGDWVEECLTSRFATTISTRNLLITLRNELNLPVMAWSFVNAYPLRWETAPMNAMESAVLTETIELSYNYFDRLTPAQAARMLLMG